MDLFLGFLGIYGVCASLLSLAVIMSSLARGHSFAAREFVGIMWVSLPLAIFIAMGVFLSPYIPFIMP
jgi:hypothetical protein